MHGPSTGEGLIRAGRVEGQGAEQFAILGDNADVGAGDEDPHLAVLVGDADGDVS